MMQKTLLTFAFATFPLLAALGEEADPAAILARTVAAYQQLETYQSEGKVVTDMEHEGRRVKMETNFSIRLKKKPQLYLIQWEATLPNLPMNQSAAVWNAGEQPHLFMGMDNSYSKFKDDMVALSAATGISSGAAHTIPSLFFGSIFGEQSFQRLADPVLDGTEPVEGTDCYVISSSSPASNKETYWISVEDYLIVKYARSLEGPKSGRAVPELTDKMIDETLDSMGMQPTAENRERMKKMLQEASERLETTDLKGTSTELHVKISSPELDSSDFEFEIPEDATEKGLLDNLPQH